MWVLGHKWAIHNNPFPAWAQETGKESLGEGEDRKNVKCCPLDCGWYTHEIARCLHKNCESQSKLQRGKERFPEGPILVEELLRIDD